MTFAETLRRLGSVRAMVVAGEGGLDEISPNGFTFVSSLEGGVVKNSLLDAGAAVGAHYPVSAIRGGDAKANAKLLVSVLKGEEQGPYRAAAIENAAAAILVGEKAKSYIEAIELAKESIASGRAIEKMKRMIEL